MTSARGITRTVGFAFFAAALPPLAIALGWLFVAAESFPIPLWTMGCGGAALAFAGLALLVPESLVTPRAPPCSTGSHSDICRAAGASCSKR
jgi:hypothetical protein